LERTKHARSAVNSADLELDPSRWRALPVLLTGSFLSFLDFFIVNIALPSIRVDLRASAADLQLIVAAYGVAFGMSLITGGRLGDRYGRKRVFLLGIGGFSLTSAACGFAPSPHILIISRIAQAMAAAAIVPQVLATIRAEFGPDERAFAIGLYGASMGVASITAQLLGGFLVSADLFGWSWRLIFLINVPIGLAVIVYGLLTIRESARPNRSKLDPIGVILSSSVVLLLVYPIVEGRELGWPQWSICMLAASIPALVTLLLFESWLERKGGDPLIKLPLFQNLALSAGLMLSVTFYSSSGVFFIIVTVFLQQGAGYSALATGLMFLPFALGFCATSATSSRIGRRFGPWGLDLGAALMAVTLTGLALLALRCERIDPTFMLAGFLIYGLGQGLTQPALVSRVVDARSVSAEDAGAAAGLFLTTVQSSIALGVAIIGNVFFSTLGDAPTSRDYLNALSLSFVCCASLQMATFLLASFLPRRLLSHS
jgi:EmrB/QacA subfamily drug resistance transporter